MLPIEQVLPGHEVNIKVIHYGYTMGDKPPNQKIIWVVLTSKTIEENWGGRLMTGSGYIDNPFPADYFLDQDGNFVKRDFDGVITDRKVMEHLNGGRANNRTYASIVDYIADPVVKDNVRRKARSSVFDLQAGDPDQVDVIFNFRLLTEGVSPPAIYEVKESVWEDIVPPEWYTEIYSDVIAQLKTCQTFDTASEAINDTQVEDDLFGSRLFPVIKAPVSLTDKMKNHAGNFKNFSKVLSDGEFIYIGLRSKLDEIYELNEVYESGGVVLKDRQWDW